LLTPLLISQIFEVLTTRCFESAALFKVDAMHMLVQYSARDHVRMIWLPIGVDDWKGNQ
jgi:hypothetical protein